MCGTRLTHRCRGTTFGVKPRRTRLFFPAILSGCLRETDGRRSARLDLFHRLTAEADQPPRNPGATESLMADAELVRLRAHQIFQGRMAAGAPGDSLSDWLQAQRAIRER